MGYVFNSFCVSYSTAFKNSTRCDIMDKNQINMPNGTYRQAEDKEIPKEEEEKKKKKRKNFSE